MQTQVPGVLPDAVDFMRQVERNRIIEGVYPISAMPRLSGTLLNNEGFAEEGPTREDLAGQSFARVRLEFGDSVGFASLKGKVTANLTVQCQRCMLPMEMAVVGRFKFALVHSEDDFEFIPEEFEPLLLADEEQSIIDIVEDELLLCIPMVTVHEADCSEFMKVQEASIKAEKEASHPFAALGVIKGVKKGKPIKGKSIKDK